MGIYLLIIGDAEALPPTTLTFYGVPEAPSPAGEGREVDWDRVLPAPPPRSRTQTPRPRPPPLHGGAAAGHAPEAFGHLVALVDEAAEVDVDAAHSSNDEDDDEDTEEEEGGGDDQDDCNGPLSYLGHLSLEELFAKFPYELNHRWELHGHLEGANSSASPVLDPSWPFGKNRCIMGSSLRADCGCHWGPRSASCTSTFEGGSKKLSASLRDG